MSPSAADPISDGDIDTEPSSTSGTINTLPDELLLAILGVLSHPDRAKALTVSKKWNNLIMDLGTHLEPLFVDHQKGIPFYANDVTIRLNPCVNRGVFDSLQESLIADLPHAELTRVVTSYVPYWRLSEYLTDPPVSTLAIQVAVPSRTPKQLMAAVMRTATPAAPGPKGLRVCDLLDAYSEMRAYDTDHSLQGWGFTAWLATTREGFVYEKVGKNVTRNGVEVRKCRRRASSLSSC